MVLVALNREIGVQEDEPHAANYISFAAYSDMLEQAVLLPRDAPRAATAWQTQAEPWS